MVRWLMMAVALTVASGAWAQVRQALYIGGAAGSSKLTYDTGSLPIANTTASTFSVNDDSDTAFKVFGGWRVNPYFAGEVGIVDFGKFSATRTATAPLAGSVRSDITVTGVYVDAVGIAPLGSVAELFAKAGVLFAGVSSTRTTTGAVTIGGARSSDDTASSTGLHVGAGLNFRITSRVWLRVEYERAYSVGDQKLGEGDVSAFTLGASYRF